MRNPDRLDDFYSQLCEIHKKSFPDWRFGQLCSNFFGWLASEKKMDLFFPEESQMLTFEKPTPIVKTDDYKDLFGLTFVITGSLNHFSNRDELKNKIETYGGKVSGSISAKTSYLINNDVNSTSSKNQKAKSLNIPIISEKQFLSMIR